MSIDSRLASSMKPQVLTMATLASPASATRRYPARTREASMISLSTAFLAQPSETRAAVGLPSAAGGASRLMTGIWETSWI